VRKVLTRSDDPQVASASLNLVRSIMRELGLYARQPRPYRITTLRDETATDDHRQVRRDFTATTPRAGRMGPARVCQHVRAQTAEDRSGCRTGRMRPADRSSWPLASQEPPHTARGTTSGRPCGGGRI
jgi:hypothetical protein